MKNIHKISVPILAVFCFVRAAKIVTSANLTVWLNGILSGVLIVYLIILYYSKRK